MPFLTVNVIDCRAQPMVEHGSSQESISRGKAEKSNLGENVVAVLKLSRLRMEEVLVLHFHTFICVRYCSRGCLTMN